MKHCKTCKFWNVEDTKNGWPLCDRIRMFDGSFGWNDAGDDWALKPQYANETALAEDGSGYMAQLRTKADFGCTLHEDKPNE